MLLSCRYMFQWIVASLSFGWLNTHLILPTEIGRFPFMTVCIHSAVYSSVAFLLVKSGKTEVQSIALRKYMR